MKSDEKVGILVTNVGTPSAPTPSAVRAYLREFLSDPHVMDSPAPLRWLLLHAIILPRRPRRVAPLYRKHWTERGGPLLAVSRDLVAGLRERLPGAAIELGFRYGTPSIAEALDALIAENVARVIVAPLFPQYAYATTGSALAEVHRRATPPLAVLPPFHGTPEFLDAWVALAQPRLEAFKPDHVVLSYHGLPVRHIRKADRTGRHCLEKPDCCDALTDVNRTCYRAQCFATTRDLAARLGWAKDTYTTCFQSRFGRRTRWIGPRTNEVLVELGQRSPAEGGWATGTRVALLCPSFVADSLETLEELDVQARQVFLHAGGEAFELLPCLNTHPAWLDGLAALLKQLAE